MSYWRVGGRALSPAPHHVVQSPGWRGVSWYRQMTSDGEHSEQILELRVTLAKLKQRPPSNGELRLADDDREILLIKLLL